MWNDLVHWFSTTDGWRVTSGAIIPFVAIVIAGFIAAGIGRGGIRRLVAQRDHETRASAVSALISAGQNAARWHSQSPAAREHAEHLASEADVTVRLLPIAGAGLAADWSAHQLAELRTNSVSFSYQADQTLAEYRDRLVEWLHRPNRAKKLFVADLDRWGYDQGAVDPIITEQQTWAQQQFPDAAPASSASSVAASSAPLPELPLASNAPRLDMATPASGTQLLGLTPTGADPR